MIENHLSGIKYQVSSIKYHVLSIKYQVSSIKYDVSMIRVQVEAGESKLLLFETFSLVFFFSLEGFIEELALLKMSRVQKTSCS